MPGSGFLGKLFDVQQLLAREQEVAQFEQWKRDQRPETIRESGSHANNESRRLFINRVEDVHAADRTPLVF